MVESKIYREDELEGTVTRYRNMLAKHNVPGFTTTSDTTTPSAGGASESQAKMSNGSSATGHSDEACELCGDKRHDLLSCPLMNNSVDASTQPWCDNCEK